MPIESHLKKLSMRLSSRNKLFNGDPSFKKTVLLFPEIYKSNSDLRNCDDSDFDNSESQYDIEFDVKKNHLKKVRFQLDTELNPNAKKILNDKQICNELMKLSNSDVVEATNWMSPSELQKKGKAQSINILSPNQKPNQNFVSQSPQRPESPKSKTKQCK